MKTTLELAQTGALAARFVTVREGTAHLCTPLDPEDCVAQSMPDCSPVKWHLAHTTWFFEQFVLMPHAPGCRPHHPRYAELFNSYYDAVGPQLARASRGLLTRPTLAEVRDYRAAVDWQVQRLLGLENLPAATLQSALQCIELGLQHEQQHQELLLTDLKHLFSANPLRPAYAPADTAPAAELPSARPPPHDWILCPNGLFWIGHSGNREAQGSFAFDNEGPRHREFLQPCEIGTRLVTAGEFLAFIEAGGYARPEYWLSDGWQAVQTHQWKAPQYWQWQEDRWWMATLHGWRPVDADEPVCHVSYFEADAFARWAGARLPTEAEWEVAASQDVAMAPPGAAQQPTEQPNLHPSRARAVQQPSDGRKLLQLYDACWQWTASAHLAYPGFRPAPGALGEYNGKFMSGQMVLRGGSCVTPSGHARPTYRNFFHPDARWQFTGIRLARSL